MGNCIHKSSSHLSPSGSGDERCLISPSKKAPSTSNSSVATTACVSPISTASASSHRPRSPSSSPDRLDTLVSSVAVGSPMSDDTINNSADSLDHQRIEGQQRLRDLVVTGAEAGQIDWKSIIKLAEDLHKKEQQQLRSSSSSVLSKGGNRTNISRNQAFFERRRKKKDLARRKKMESVGSFSVNLLMHDADEYRAIKGHQSSSVSEPTDTSCAIECASPTTVEREPDENELQGSESEDEIDVFEDDDTESMSSSKAPIPTRHSRPTPTTTMNKPQFIVEGSFMAATTLFDLPKINDDEEDSSSSSSSNSSTASDTFGRSFNNDGLVTIHEDSSVSTWQQQWKQYLR
mmetsp:Transcript_17869/g.26642  ORF Transcript_17869/g.26642 Transcript_17869/m.26642 type:complete len:347 (+) Transcript_17869:144-1184(+)